MALPRRRRLIGGIAGGLAAALVVTLAVFSEGYRAQEMPLIDTAVWVSRDAGQYARVNTETGELDTVRQASEPAQIIQSGGAGVLFSAGLSRAWPINAAFPEDLVPQDAPSAADAEPGADVDTTAVGAPSGDAPGAGGPVSEATPSGTREALAAGNYFAFRTESGTVHLGSLADPAVTGATSTRGASGAAATASGRVSAAREIDPLAEREALGPEAESTADAIAATESEDVAQTGYAADAIALSPAGTLAMYSSAENGVRLYDGAAGRFIGSMQTVPEAAAAVEEPQLTLLGTRWALLDPEDGMLWRSGTTDTASLDLGEDALLQRSTSTAPANGEVLVADDRGLWAVPESGTATRVVQARGVPARPTTVGEDRFAAWLDSETGTLWTGEKSVALAYDPESGAANRRLNPVIQSNGTRAVLSDRETGLLWNLPDGSAIPVAQWSLNQPPRQDTGTVVVDDATEELPPVAVPDRFGVRAGAQAELPVMLNDFDPNKKDVLSIVPESLSAVEPAGFGTLSVLPGQQRLAISVSPGVSGSATFSYRITDGTLESEPAVVTLTVHDSEENSAPTWCGVEGCQLTWPTPQITSGGTLALPILEGWVDADGDPMMLAAAAPREPDTPVRVVAGEDGRVILRHLDPNAPDSAIPVEVTVRDARGTEATRTLTVAVTAAASPQIEPSVLVVPVGEQREVSALERVSGGSGLYELVDAIQPQGAGAGLQLTPQQGRGTLIVAPAQVGTYPVQITVRDALTGTEQTGTIRVSVPAASPTLAVPPLRAFLRPMQDTVVNVLDAFADAGDRVLTVEGARVTSGELSAVPIQRETLRVSGSTEEGSTGLVGTAEITIADGQGAVATGQLTVFQVPETSPDPVIARDDRATVRAGSVVDIDVLANDVSGKGERLNLDPQVTGSGANGELAFAAGNTLRYLAPTTPGTYTLSYTAYQESAPERADIGRVRVTVVPEGANRPPAPAALSARVMPGLETRVRVPLSGVDPDGDRVRLVAVESQEAIAATLTAAGDEILLETSELAEPGLRTLTYTVRDPEGAEGTGVLRVSVGAPDDAENAPVTVSDSVRLVRGAEGVTIVEPLANDFDPARGTLELVSVVPEMTADPEDAEYRARAELLDLDGLDQGRVGITPPAEGGTFSYRYTVRSSGSKSTAEGRILVSVSDRVGPTSPVVSDTTLTAHDRGLLATGGVDVRTDRVRWSAGDPGSLTLSPWGRAGEGFRASGPKLIGEYRPEGGIVPFRLAGTDTSGVAAESYGLLIMPSLDELRLSLRGGLEPISVDENSTVTTPIADLVERIPGERLELRAGSLSVQRSAASCEASGTEIRYSAGENPPWQDRCLVEARLQGQTVWTRLAVPYRIAPREPRVELGPVTRVIRPGTEESINLGADMLSWQGDRVGNTAGLRFALSGGGTMFQVVQEGAQLRVGARADAIPGSEERLSVDVSGAGEARAVLTLRVGDVPRELPRGATLSKQCTVGTAGCRITVVGVGGEYDPFAGTPGGGLVLAAVSADSCPIARFTRSGETDIEIGWPAGQTAGGSCTVSFQVRDAQGRMGEGQLEFDAQGYPAAPAAISTVEYTGSGVTLEVALGEAQTAHPPVTGVSLDGGAGRCAPSTPGSYRCEVTGMTNGEKRQFSARAINAVGESPETTPVTSWAYQVPEVSSIAAETAYDAAVTSPNAGVAVVSIAAGGDARAFRIDGQNAEVPRSGATTVTRLTLPTGSQTIRVVPLSAFEPPIPGGSLEGGGAQTSVSVAGSPLPSGEVRLMTPDETTIVASGVGVNANGSTAPTVVTYRIAEVGAGSGTPPVCEANGSGGLIANPGDRSDGNFTGLRAHRVHEVRACVSNGFGVASVATSRGESGGPVPPPTVVSGYEVNRAAILTPKGNYEYRLRADKAPTVTATEGAVLQYRVGTAPFGPKFGLNPDLKIADVAVRQCFADDLERCSAEVPVEPITSVNEVVVSGAPSCLAADAEVADLKLVISAGAREDARVHLLPSLEGAEKPRLIVIEWGGSFAALKPLEMSVSSCAPEPPEATPPAAAPPPGGTAIPPAPAANDGTSAERNHP